MATKSECSVDDCTTMAYVKGLCCTHYRQRRYQVDEADRKLRREAMLAKTDAHTRAMKIWNRAMI